MTRSIIYYGQLSFLLKQLRLDGWVGWEFGLIRGRRSLGPEFLFPQGWHLIWLDFLYSAEFFRVVSGVFRVFKISSYSIKRASSSAVRPTMIRPLDGSGPIRLLFFTYDAVGAQGSFVPVRRINTLNEISAADLIFLLTLDVDPTTIQHLLLQLYADAHALG